MLILEMYKIHVKSNKQKVRNKTSKPLHEAISYVHLGKAKGEKKQANPIRERFSK